MLKRKHTEEVYSITGPNRLSAVVLYTPNGDYVVKFYRLGIYQAGHDRWLLNRAEAYAIADKYAERNT